ncbi:hypothetical protein R1sor_009767 [Riccia sorocarpa]|uniref:Uncharacterized protein n=1 Tax=Riccia sorocarpa TaxID=122646 RepID=A0ABD3HXU2_9MARC
MERNSSGEAGNGALTVNSRFTVDGSQTHGDSRYFGEGLHKAIKALWPDEPAAVEVKKEPSSGKRQSPVQPSYTHTVSGPSVQAQIPRLKRLGPIIDRLNEGGEFPATPRTMPSPSSPLRKSRVISSSHIRESCHSSALLSPVQLRVQRSPSGAGQIHAGFSLRRNKRAARQPPVLPIKSSPSIFQHSPIRNVRDSGHTLAPYRLVDPESLPILRVPDGVEKVGHS